MGAAPGLPVGSRSFLLPLLLLAASSAIQLASALQQQDAGRLTAPAAAAAGGGGGASGAGGLPLRDARSTMRGLVEDAGYPLEEHFATTGDGYVLGLFRIPRGAGGARSGSGSRSSSSAGDGGGAGAAAACRPPVLLLHGVLDSGAAWVLNQPDQSLGFILADAGYDVWLGNSRGNTFSRNHTGLLPTQPAFWDFTWDEMAAYDVPAVVDYVLRASECGAGRLAFVGHSQGTTQMFAALASSPALRERLSVAVMLAPACHMRHIRSPPLNILAAMGADRVFNLLGLHEFLPTREAAAALFGQICRQTPLACASIITAVAGLNTANMNLTRLQLVAQFAPSGTSVRNIVHWAQAIRKSREREAPLFQMFDYGDLCTTPSGLPRTCNMRVYHQLEPPSYDLGAISAPPLALFHGGHDRLADAADVATLLRALPPGAVVHSQFEPAYEHIDFTWGIDARERIYPKVLQLLQQFGPAPAPARRRPCGGGGGGRRAGTQ